MPTRLWRIGLTLAGVAFIAACRNGTTDAGLTVSLTANPDKLASGERSTLTWSASQPATCTAAGEWSGTHAASGSAPTAALTNKTNVFSIRCTGDGGASRAATVVTVIGGRRSGLDFQGSASTTGTVRFRFTQPLDIYPATYIWRILLRSQPEYYTTFFWGNDGEFRWDEGVPDTYYGAHPYPFPAPHFVAGPKDVGPRYWEIAVAGLDVLSKQQVEYGRWHTQALRVWSDMFGKHHEFYWDLPDTTRVIRQRQPRSYGEKNPPRPALTWGDAPWNPSNEIMDGIIRGIQIYTVSLDLDDVLAESEKPLSTTAGAAHVWYINSDPTPTDISDKSGAGHDPEWVGPERPLLWTDH